MEADSIRTAVHHRDAANYDGPGHDEQVCQEGGRDGGVAAKAFVDFKPVLLDNVILVKRLELAEIAKRTGAYTGSCRAREYQDPDRGL